MPTYRLLKHKDYDSSVRNLPPSIQQKALWAQVLLGTRGRTPSVKGTTGLDLRWRRTPVQGNHFYMWWIPQSESGLASGSNGVGVNGHASVEADAPNSQSILIHSVRHHDATSSPISTGYIDDYREVAVADLDPRFAEQRRIARQLEPSSGDTGGHQRPISLATVKGLPGSGKTISLLYLVRDLLHRTDQGNILYITYTSRLKRAAEEFLMAQDPAFAERVQLKTLSEIQSAITGMASPTESFRSLDDFSKFLNLQNTSTLGPWRRYPHALYTEIRAHLLGRDFPSSFDLFGQKMGTQSTRLEPLSANSYAKMRKLDIESAEIAQRVSVRAAASRFFREQKAAQRALEILLEGQMPKWLLNLSGLLVDEVQDLTLLQLAFLGEMVKTAVDVQSRGSQGERFQHTPFVFTVAGDESQIVQPTGFDWGVTKDMLAAQLGVHPQEYEFQHQRRSPRALATLVENSWNFYGHLPKSLRPSARRDAFIDESVAADHQYEDSGRILLCGDLSPDWSKAGPNGSPAGRALSGASKVRGGQQVRTSTRNRAWSDPTTAYVEQTRMADWHTLFDEMVDKPGRILIDLTEQLRGSLAESTKSLSDEVLFLPREIKGLERANVIIYGLNALYERAIMLCEDGDEDNIPFFEARRLFDEVRVAVSRSTNTLTLLEPPTAPVLAHLGLTEASLNTPEVNTISWGDLVDMLRTEEMSELEAIERYLDEVEDLIERNRWELAHRRNRRAHALAVEIMDFALQRDADSQRVEIHIQEAANLFNREEWSPAYQSNRKAHEFAMALGDPLVLDKVDSQVQSFRSELLNQARLQLEQAQNWYESSSYKIALRDVNAALDLAQAIQDDALIGEVNGIKFDVCTDWAYQLAGSEATASELVDAQLLLQQAADIADSPRALLSGTAKTEKAWKNIAQQHRIIAERYKAVTNVGNLQTHQIESVLSLAQRWEDVAPVDARQTSGMRFVLRWLDEVYQSLGENLAHYYEWASVTEMVIDRLQYSDTQADPLEMANLEASLSSDMFDEYLWILENRVEEALAENPDRSKRIQRSLDQFDAFMLGYGGSHGDAAKRWESLGSPAEAARQARKAGQLEYAYDLLRKAKAAIPEELAVSVKAVRLLDQLAAKHDGLNDAEKNALSQRLGELQRQLGGEDNPPLDDDVWVFGEDN